MVNSVTFDDGTKYTDENTTCSIQRYLEALGEKVETIEYHEKRRTDRITLTTTIILLWFFVKAREFATLVTVIEPAPPFTANHIPTCTSKLLGCLILPVKRNRP